MISHTLSLESSEQGVGHRGLGITVENKKTKGNVSKAVLTPAAVRCPRGFGGM